MKKAAIYVRVSGEYQTVDRQIKELTQFAELNSYEVIKIFEEKISAYKDLSEREKLLELFEYAKNKECDIILFSEFTRLARTVSELLRHIETFRANGVELYFQKQNLWIKGEKDYLTSMLISVLGVVSEYEVELFTGRAISGKINAFQNKNIAWGNAYPYGYLIENKTKELIINVDEASVVKDIFDMYLNGKSTMFIADYLNANEITPPFYRRSKQSEERRRIRGIEKKEYKKIEVDKLRWTNQSVLYILKNKVYTGVREITFHEADPQNKLPIRKRKKRKEIGTFVKKEKKLEIINEVDFELVQQLIIKNQRGKNSEIKRLNLLRDKLVCGNCNSNFCVKGSNGKRIYKCYGREDRMYRKHNCIKGLDVRMDKLDGLVIQLVSKLLVEINMTENITNKISDLKDKIFRITDLLDKKEIEINKLNQSFKKQVKNVVLMDVGNSDNIKDSILKELYQDLKQDFDKNSGVLNEEKKRLLKELQMNKIKIKSLNRFEQTTNIKEDMDLLKKNPILLKELINSYIDSIVIYKVASYWSLVVVKFVFGGELWGTIKSRKYKLDEIFFDPFYTPRPEYKSWFIDNTDLAFVYDKENNTFYYNGKSKIMNDLNEGVYTYDELNDYFANAGWIGSFALYDYEAMLKNIEN